MGRYNYLAAQLRILEGRVDALRLWPCGSNFRNSEQAKYARAQLASHEVHMTHCQMLGETTHYPTSAAARARPIIGDEAYRAARRTHRYAAALRHPVEVPALTWRPVAKHSLNADAQEFVPAPAFDVIGIISSWQTLPAPLWGSIYSKFKTIKTPPGFRMKRYHFRPHCSDHDDADRVEGTHGAYAQCPICCVGDDTDVQFDCPYCDAPPELRTQFANQPLLRFAEEEAEKEITNYLARMLVQVGLPITQENIQKFRGTKEADDQKEDLTRRFHDVCIRNAHKVGTAHAPDKGEESPPSKPQ